MESRSSEVVVWNCRACSELAGERLAAHACDAVARRSRNDERAGEQFVAGGLRYRVRFAGEQALVDFAPAARRTSPSTAIWSPVEISTRSSMTSSRRLICTRGRRGSLSVALR